MHLVFVHLGNAKARHLRPNIERTKRLFPEVPITLIYSEPEFIRNYNNLGIDFHHYREVSEENHVLTNLSHNSKFRNNFWRYSIERIYALEQWHSENPSAKVIHLESDILLMPNFPFFEFNSINVLGWCSFNDTHDVASIMYSPNYVETKWLIEELNQTLIKDPSLTDMTGLRCLKMSFPERALYLNSEAGSRILGGLLDAAPFGMYLCGRDPRNYSGFTRRFMNLPESQLDPGQYVFSFDNKKNLMVKSPQALTSKLFNLHVHSKQKSIFGNRWRFSLKLLVITAKYKFPRRWFSPRAFLELAIDFFQRNRRMSVHVLIKRVFNYK
jgi:hypothetical protein